jgi:hypothetical protein
MRRALRARATRKIWRGGRPRGEDDFVLLGKLERDGIVGDDLGGVGVSGIVESRGAFDAQRDGTADHLITSKNRDIKPEWDVVEKSSSPQHV